MRTYKYLSNDLPRELIELYSDIEQSLLKIMVTELSKGTEPQFVFAKMQEEINKYDDEAQKVLAVMFRDIKQKAVRDGNKDFAEEETEAEAVNNNEANAMIRPLVIGSMAVLMQLNKQITANAINDYNLYYAQAKSGYISSLEVLQQIYKGIAKKGLTIFESFGGGKSKNYSIENVIRRDVMYKVNQVGAKVNMANFKKSSAKFVEVSSHPTARTWNKYQKQPYEDHSSWQGQVYYSRDKEQIEGYKEFESTCGYGELLGIGGINCYHQFALNYTGESVATQYDKDLVEKQYALSQKQRALERNIRKIRSEMVVYEAGQMTKEYKESQERLKIANAKLKSFCDKNNVKYYRWRTLL